MNAPARIASARDRYIPIVTHHMPGCAGDELTFRCSILLLRDQAGSSLRRCSEEAAGVLLQVQRLATLHAYAPMAIEELAELRRQLTRLVSCASGLEMFAFRLAGGTDEGG